MEANQAILLLSELLHGMQQRNCLVFSYHCDGNQNFPFIVKMSSNEKKMKKQCKVFATAEKMTILAEADAHVGTQVNLVAMLGLSILTLNTMVSQWSEIEKSYSCCGP
jgi:hypothetical protein